MKISAKDGRYLFNTLVISLMVMALLYTVQPYLSNGDLKQSDVLHAEHAIVGVTPPELDRLVQSKTGKPVMLMLYASWCGYCKQMMPMLVDLAKTSQLGDIEPVFVSLDDQPRLLSKYLLRQGYDGAFTPYRFKQGFNYRPFNDFIENTGSHYRGAIPYLGFFHPNGRLITDAAGVVGKEDVLKVVERVREIKE